MHYYKVPLRRTEYVTEPDFPEGTLFSWVHYAADFAVIETTEWQLDCPGAEPIKGSLEALLASSTIYPPARALAARDLEDSKLAWPEFAERLEQLLTKYFTGQATSGFSLLRCLKDQGDSLEMFGHGGVGHFYWALAAAEGLVAWVSDVDYMIHWAPLDEFEIPLDRKLPAELPGSPS